jgi:hypothetical protein
MSKNNNLATRARIHAADLARERALKARSETKAAKKAAKAARLPAGVGGASVTGPRVRSRPRAFKVKKGVRIKGIKVVDAESKKAALAALRAAAAENAMAVDAPKKAG